MFPDVPYFNRLYKNVGIGRSNQYVWIPRSAVIVRGRTLAADHNRPETPDGDDPAQGTDCTVHTAAQDEETPQRGRVVAVSDDEVTLDVQIHELIHTPIPVLRNIPFVGEQFHRTDFVSRQSKCRIPLDDIVCIRVDNSASFSPPSPNA